MDAVAYALAKTIPEGGSRWERKPPIPLGSSTETDFYDSGRIAPGPNPGQIYHIGTDYSVSTPHPPSTFWMLDLSTNEWTPLAPDPAGNRAGIAFCRMTNGKYFALGGQQGNFFTQATRVYDPATNTWESKKNAARTWAYGTALPLSGNRVLALGPDGGTVVDSTPQTAMYDYDNDTWSYLPGSITIPARETVPAVIGNKVYHASRSGTTWFRSYDVDTNVTTDLPSPAPFVPSGVLGRHILLAIPGNKIVCIQGSPSIPLVYDISTSTWSYWEAGVLHPDLTIFASLRSQSATVLTLSDGSWGIAAVGFASLSSGMFGSGRYLGLYLPGGGASGLSTLKSWLASQ